MTASSNNYQIIIAENSCDFLETAIGCLNEGQAFVSVPTSRVEYVRKLLGTQSDPISPQLNTGWYDGKRYTPKDDTNTAQIALSSGTEGEPKAIKISHSALAHTTQRLINIMSMNEQIREYVGVPVYHSFGFGRCRTVSAVGGKFFIPANGFNPVEIAEMLERSEINAVSAVPSLWRLLLQAPDIFTKAARENMKWIEIGSQYMTATEKTALKTLFPHAVIVQHYGLTEASRTTFLKIHECENTALESVGTASDGVVIKIDPNGLICISGPHVSTSVIKNETELASTDSEGWLITSDLGEIKDGNLYFLGRQDDLINCGGIKLSPEQIESEIREKTTLSSGYSIFGAPDELRGAVPAIAYDPSLSTESISTIKSTLATLLKQSNVTLGKDVKELSLPELPVTPTGKIKRKQLIEIWNSQNQPQDVESKPSVPKTTHDEKTLQIIDIWKTCLGIDRIESNDSFFDLGGDSLSAIRVSVAMEKAGVPRTLCRKVFQGASIEKIVSELQPRSAEIDSGVVDKIIQIWGDSLNITGIKASDNFFDLGGDSLSAIRVSVAMEKAGIPRGVSRKVFQGISIEQIASEVKTTRASTDEATEVRTPLATGSHTLNVVRGLLVILNISSHWMPGVIARLGGALSQLNNYFAPLYSSGTPGFAIVFGAGIGYFVYPRFLKSPESVSKLVFRNASILAIGIFALALVRIAADYVNTGAFDPIHASNSFWSVLTFYFAFCLSMPIWLKLLSRGSLQLNSLVFATSCYLIHMIIDSIDIPASQNVLVQPIILLLTAKYNFFEMSSGVALGIFFGSLFRENILSKFNSAKYITLSICLVLLSIFISVEAGQEALWWVWPKANFTWSWLFYLAFVIFLCVTALYVENKTKSSPFLSNLINGLSIIGVMAFPLFILHELVIPFKNLLSGLGVPAALPISLGLFFILATYITVKLYRIYFSKQPVEDVEL